MKNAKKLDVDCLISGKYRYVANQVAFLVRHPWFGDFKASFVGYNSSNTTDVPPLLMETMQGGFVYCEISWIHEVPRKQGTPAKPKHIHVKGSKPYLSNQSAYCPSLIKVGTKVLCRDKKIRVVLEVGNSVVVFDNNLTSTSSVYLDCGRDYRKGTNKPQDIMKIIVDKPIRDPYQGYAVNVWHFWQGASKTPPVDGDVKVQVWCRGHKEEVEIGSAYPSEYYR